jgi:hypothetical protein
MKKLLFAALFLTGFTLITPPAQAGHTELVFAGYDRCGRPVYRYIQRSSSHCHSHSSYYAPSRYQSYSYGRHYDSGRSYQERCSSSRSRFSISFGF